MTKDEALRMVLKNLKIIEAQDQGCGGNVTEAEAWKSAKRIAWHTINFCEEALAQTKQKQEQDKPVAWWNGEEGVVFAHDQICIPNWTDHYYIPLYAKPQTKEWVGLTDEDDIDWEEGDSLRDLFKAIESKLKEKNT